MRISASTSIAFFARYKLAFLTGGLFLMMNGFSIAQSSEYVLFTVNFPEQREQWGQLHNLLESSNEIATFRINPVNRHVYVEPVAGNAITEEMLSPQLQVIGFHIGCFRKSLLDGTPMEYFDLRQCDILQATETK